MNTTNKKTINIFLLVMNTTNKKTINIYCFLRICKQVLFLIFDDYVLYCIV